MASDTPMIDGSQVSFVQAGTNVMARTMQDKVRERVSFLDYSGVVGDGVHDDTAGIAAALAYASSKGITLVAEGWERFLISQTLHVYTPAGVRMNGARFVTAPNFRADAVTYNGYTYYPAVVISGAAGVANTAGPGYLMEMALQGPYGGPTHSSPPNIPLANYVLLDGFLLTGDTSQLNEFDFRPWVEGFRHNIILGGSHTYLVKFHKPHNAKFWQSGWRLDRVSDFGENISVDGGVTFNGVNSAGTAVGLSCNGLQASTSMYFDSHSFDYNDSMFDWQAGDGQLVLNKCHLENGNNLPLGTLDSPSGYGAVHLTDCTIWPQGGATGYTPTQGATGRPSLFVASGVSGQFRISGGYATLYGRGDTEIVTNNTPAAGPAGFGVIVDGLYIPVALHQPPLVSKALNGLDNGDFGLGSLQGWTTFGGTGLTVSVVTDNATASGYALKMTGASMPGYAGVGQLMPVRPGRHVILRCAMQFNNTLAGAGTAQLEIRFFNQAGVQIGQNYGVDAIPSTNTQTGYLLRGNRVIVPPGATMIRVDLYAISLNGDMYFSNVSAIML